MLAAKLFGAGDVRLTECEIPEIGHGELLLKTSVAAICGSDLRMIANGYKGVDEAHPLTLGHEISGVITRVGDGVHGYTQGMRVSLAPNIGCGVCDLCVSGNTHLCRSYRAFGINMDGGFAEYVRVPADAVAQGNVMVLGGKVNMEAAALFEPMSCVMNGHSRVGVRMNDSVLVMGAGPIGVMHAQLAMAEGASRVLVYDLSKDRMEQCARAVPGAIAVTGENVIESVMQMTGGRGVDVCITACPSGAAQAQTLELTSMNGRILLFGGLPAGRDKVTMDTNLIHYKQLAIHGSTRGNIIHYREVAKMSESGSLQLEQLVSRRFCLGEFLQAVDYAGSAAGLKTVITFE